MSDSNQQWKRMKAASDSGDRNRWRKMGGRNHNIAAFAALLIIGAVWYTAAHIVNQPFLFPFLEDVLKEVIYSLSDLYVLRNLAITMRRVLTGSLYAFIIGFPLGMLMGYSPKLLRTMSPFMNSLRQVAIMAWVTCNCMVWNRRRSNCFPNCFQWYLHDHP